MSILDHEIRSGFELLRSVFAGIASRHDQVLSRVVIAEAEYGQFLGGPDGDDFAVSKRIAFNGLTLREPNIRLVSPEEKEQILAARPDARLEKTATDEDVYIQTGVQSQMIFIGDTASLTQFKTAARDAGFFLIRFLHNRRVDLKIPELVSFDAIATVRSRSGSTNLPSDLFERWVAFLHILGWQALTNVPLRAERTLWHENFRISGDPEKVQAALLEGMPEMFHLQWHNPIGWLRSLVVFQGQRELLQG